MTADQLVLGIDGGGTKTVALLASAAAPETILARGISGPSNPRAVGFERALAALDAAVYAAFQALQPACTGGTPVPSDSYTGKMPVPPIFAACLGLAGAGRASERRELERWASNRQLARNFVQVHDALPVLAAGAADLCGVALIAGTGSLAFGRNRQRQTARCGGWGYLFGDEGSGYAVGIAALRAVAQAADGRGPATTLTDHVLKRAGVAQPANLVEAVYQTSFDRPQVAALAELVFDAARSGDAVATALVEQAVGDLAEMVVTVAKRLALDADHFPLALTGGLLLAGHDLLTPRIEAHLRNRGLASPSLVMVREPALGAVQLAALAITDKELLSTVAQGTAD